MSSQKKYYVYPPEVRGIKYNGNEVNRLYLNGREVYDANRMTFKVTTNSEAKFGFSHYCDQEHFISVQLKGLGSDSWAYMRWNDSKRNAGWSTYTYKGSMAKPNKDYVLSVKIIPIIGKPISRLMLGNQNTYSKLKAIYSWGGGVEITGLHYVFRNAHYDIEEVPDYLPKSCTSLRGLFTNCTRGIPKNIEKWDTSRVKDLAYTFFQANMGKIRVGQWDVGSLQDGAYTFYESSLNENLGGWRPKNATTLKKMMYRTEKNVSCDLRNWCIPKVNRAEETEFAYRSPFALTRKRSFGRYRYYYWLAPTLPQFGDTRCR